MSSGVWLLVILLLLGFLFLRVWAIIPGEKVSKKVRRSDRQPLSCLLVLGSGGHTAEMFRILRGMKTTNYHPRIYIKAEDDTISLAHCTRFECEYLHSDPTSYRVLDIPRARQVGQSYFTSVFTTLKALGVCFRLLWTLNPAVIICNGPGTCVPICLAAYVRRFMGSQVKIIYVESICRVEDISLSAKMLYLLVDRLFVQWPSLQTKYPKSEYIGLLSH